MSAIVIVVAASVAVVATIVWIGRPLWQGTGPGVSPDPRIVALLSERESVLAQIRDLDSDREAGRLGLDDWNSLRARLMDRGVAVLAALDGLEAVSRGESEQLAAALEAEAAALSGAQAGARDVAAAVALLLLAWQLWQPSVAAAQGTPSANPAESPSAWHGLELYRERCAECHGFDGRGDGRLAAELPVELRSFADAEFMRSVAPGEHFAIITEGRIDNLMPPWKDALSEAERWDVLYGAWSFYLSPDRLVRGRSVWESACADCHGSPSGLGESVDWYASAHADIFDVFQSVPQHTAAPDSNGLVGEESDVTELTELSDADLRHALDFARTGSFVPLPFESLSIGGKLAGTVHNGTRETPQAGAIVTATARLGGVPGAQVTGATNAVGAFELDGLVWGPETSYVLASSHDGVAYETEVPLSDVTSHAELMVYESDPAVDVTAEVSMLIVPDPPQGRLQVLELWTVVNRTRLTRISPDGASVIAPVLPGAQQLTVENAELVTAGTGTDDSSRIGIARAFPPGETELTLEYVAPYRSTTLDILRSFSVAVDQFRIAVTGSGPELTGAGFGPRTLGSVAGTPVVSWVSGDIAPGSQVAAVVDGLPAATGQSLTLPLEPPPVKSEWLAAAGLLLTAVGVVVAVAYPRLAAGPLRDRHLANLRAERAWVVGRLAELDARRSAGSISENEYRRRRAELLARGVRLAHLTQARAHDE